MEVHLDDNEKVIVGGYIGDIEITGGGRNVLNGDIIKPQPHSHIFFCRETGEIILHNWSGIRTWKVGDKDYPLEEIR